MTMRDQEYEDLWIHALRLSFCRWSPGRTVTYMDLHGIESFVIVRVLSWEEFWGRGEKGIWQPQLTPILSLDDAFERVGETDWALGRTRRTFWAPGVIHTVHYGNLAENYDEMWRLQQERFNWWNPAIQEEAIPRLRALDKTLRSGVPAKILRGHGLLK